MSTRYNTGNPIESTDVRDMSDNAKNFDEFSNSSSDTFTDRLGYERLTVNGAIKRTGFKPGYGDFTTGFTVMPGERDIAWYDPVSKNWYSYLGVIPSPSGYPVAPGTNPISSPLLWAPRTEELAISKINEIEYYSSGYVSADYRIKNLKLLSDAHKRLKANEALVIVCVGDSMTYGYDINSPDVLPPEPPHVRTKAPIQYPMQLQTNMALFTSVPTTVINRGYSGDTAKKCYERWTINPNGHVAHIMLGINDASANLFSEYMIYMEKLIQRYVDWGCGVVLHTATDQTFNNTNPPASYYTQCIRSLAETYGCPVFESEEVHQFRLYDAVHSDGTHYNKTGYAHYGNAVTSFILAGGWVHQHRKMNSLTNFQSGRASEGIGFNAKGFNLGTTVNSYVTSGSWCTLFAGNTGIVSFHFYMDCDIANFSIVGQVIGANVSIGRSYNVEQNDVNRLTLKADQNRRVFETIGGIVKTGRPGAGKNTLAGTLVGRGWKTIYVQVTSALADSKYLQGIIFEPMKEAEVSQSNTGNFRKATEEIFIYKNPDYAGDVNTALPPAVVLAGDIFMPLPYGLYPYAGTSFFESPFVYVTILTSVSSDNAIRPNGVTHLILSRKDPTSEFRIDKVFSTLPACIVPTAAGVGSSVYVENDPNPVGVNKTAFPSGTQQGWLWFTFPATTITAYYTIEVRCANKGTESHWFA